jgi:hypothetical protein
MPVRAAGSARRPQPRARLPSVDRVLMTFTMACGYDTSATYRLRVARQPMAMRTPDGKWTVDLLTTHGDTLFRVRRRAAIGAHGGAGCTPIGIGVTIDEVSELLGDDLADLNRGCPRRVHGG